MTFWSFLHIEFLFLAISNSALLSSNSLMKGGSSICPANFQPTSSQKYLRTKARANEHLRPLGRRKAVFWLRIINFTSNQNLSCYFLCTESKSLTILKYVHGYCLPDAKIILMKSETFSQLYESFVLKSQSSAIWQDSRAAEKTTNASAVERAAVGSSR